MQNKFLAQIVVAAVCCLAPLAAQQDDKKAQDVIANVRRAIGGKKLDAPQFPGERQFPTSNEQRQFPTKSVSSQRDSIGLACDQPRESTAARAPKWRRPSRTQTGIRIVE